MKNILLALFIIIFIFIPFVTNGNEFKRAEGYLKNEDYKMSFNIFSKLALSGNSKVQIKLGIMYKLGQGINPDYVIASK